MARIYESKSRVRPVLALTRWRQSAGGIDPGTNAPRGLSITAAAAQYSAHIGAPIAYQMWWGWEKGTRRPNARNMVALFEFTGGPDSQYAVRPGDFFALEQVAA